MDPNSPFSAIDREYMLFLSEHYGYEPSELVRYWYEEEDADYEESDSASVTASYEESADDEDSAVESEDVVVVDDEGESNERRSADNSGGVEGSSSKDSKVEQENVDVEGQLNRGGIDGLICSICFEPWSSGGDHRVCCLPCGHIYGFACIKKWLQDRGAGKCPQCNRKCTVKSIRILYAPRVVAIDEELQKKVRFLEAKCSSLKQQNDDLTGKRVEWQKKEADLLVEVNYLKERTRHLEDLLERAQSWPSGSSVVSCGSQGEAVLGDNIEQEFHLRGSSNSFKLQAHLQAVDGARIFDIDSSNQILIIARRLSRMGMMNALTKMSLIPSYETEDIHLPAGFKAVKDLRVAPHARLVLLASLGKKLSVVSTQNNNTVLTYDLPAAAWSCSWDLGNSHYIYAGLQNGMLVQFDTRQTGRPVESLTGLTGNPIHTVHSLSADSTLRCGVKGVLTASSVGLCHWNFGSHEKRPYLIPESENQGVCISFAYSPSSDDVVASFRPKIETSCDFASPPTLSASASLAEEGVRGSHVLYKRMGGRYERLGVSYANVSGIRLPRTAIVDGVFRNPLFASGDEVTSELVLHELPFFKAVQHLQSRKYPIRDVKYARILNSGLLSCLTEDSLQLFSSKLLLGGM